MYRILIQVLNNFAQKYLDYETSEQQTGNRHRECKV